MKHDKKIWSIYVDENEENQHMLTHSEAVALAEKWIVQQIVNRDEKVYLCNTETNEFFEVENNEVDPTPYCTDCGAQLKRNCDCDPIAENN